MSKGFESLSIEPAIQQEKVSSLAATAEKLERLLAQLSGIQERVGKVGETERWELARQYRTVRAQAEKQRWYLLVQREAMGLANHGDVERIYPLPPPLS